MLMSGCFYHVSTPGNRMNVAPFGPTVTSAELPFMVKSVPEKKYVPFKVVVCITVDRRNSCWRTCVAAV